jgi:hypothetical protein
MDRTLGLHRRIDRVGADQDGVFPLVVDAGWVPVTGGRGVELLGLALASSTPIFQSGNFETNSPLFAKNCKTFVSAVSLTIFLSILLNS